MPKAETIMSKAAIPRYTKFGDRLVFRTIMPRIEPMTTSPVIIKDILRLSGLGKPLAGPSKVWFKVRVDMTSLMKDAER